VGAAVVAFYEVGNRLFGPDAVLAHHHAVTLWAWEQHWHLDIEHAVQGVVNGFQIHGHHVLRRLMAYLYIGPHFVVTGAFVAWLFWRRRHAVAAFRNVLAVFTVLAFAYQWYFPMAPPWATPETGLDYTLPDIGIDGRTAEATVNTMAAFPSVHTGWAITVGIFGFLLTRGWWRLAFAAYPLVIVTCILATGNHLVVDALGALPFLGLAYLGHLGLQRLSVAPRVQRPG
jgi:hypothetical protein